MRGFSRATVGCETGAGPTLKEPDDADVLSDCERLLFFKRFEDDVLFAKELKFVLGTVMMLDVGDDEGMAIAPLLRSGGDCKSG